MQTRRDFIKQAGVLMVAGAFLTPKFSQAAKLNKFGIQLYTLRDVIEKDTKNVLTHLSKDGYKELEAYGVDTGKFFGHAAKEFKKMVDDLGMKTVSTHASMGRPIGKTAKDGLDVCAPKWKKAVEAANEAGLKYINIPYLEDHFRKTEDDVKQTAEIFNKLAEYAKAHGLDFAYHNHDFEFQKVGDKEIYDILLAETDAKLVKFEMDLFWVIYAEKDPIAYFDKHPGRFPMWHIKDMNKTNRKENIDVGKGSIDFIKLWKHSEKAGLKHSFVEQENGYNPDSITSAKNCADYLKTVNY